MARCCICCCAATSRRACSFALSCGAWRGCWPRLVTFERNVRSSLGMYMGFFPSTTRMTYRSLLNLRVLLRLRLRAFWMGYMFPAETTELPPGVMSGIDGYFLNAVFAAVSVIPTVVMEAVA